MADQKILLGNVRGEQGPAGPNLVSSTTQVSGFSTGQVLYVNGSVVGAKTLTPAGIGAAPAADGMSLYTHKKSGTEHILTGSGNNIRFVAAADFAAGDTFRVNGTGCTARTVGGDTLWAGFFRAGAVVVCYRTGNALTFNGGGLPAAEAAKLAPENIKTGVSITANGKTVTGTFTADATATAAQILSGKTAYVKGAKVVGTMADQSNSIRTITTDTSNQTLGAFRVSSNDIQIVPGKGYWGNWSWDASRMQIKGSVLSSAIGLTAGKIASGNTILGISGTFRGASGQFLVFGGTTITNGSYEDGCAYICPSNYTDRAHTSFQNTADVTFNLKAAVTGRLFMYSLSGSWQYATFSCGGTQVGIGQTSGVGTFSGQLRIQAKPNSSTYRAVLLFGIMI